MNLRPHQSRALEAMKGANKGKILIPTGGGKTLIAINHCRETLSQSTRNRVAVVVAPRILLATQLSEEFITGLNGLEYAVGHVHSGETYHWSSTNADRIAAFTQLKDTLNCHVILFTTYHSLPRIVESGIDIDIMYCDEAHNATRKDFFLSVEAVSNSAEQSFFFTATPRNTRDPHGNGMNNAKVFGDVLITVPARELIDSGSIIPPTVVPCEVDGLRNKRFAAESDGDTLISIIDQLDETKSSKVLVAVPSTKVLWNMITQYDTLNQLEERGYEFLHITSKHGAYVNRTKVNREKFFNTLNEYGKDQTKKFVLFHYSILSEGMNVPGLTHCILLRNLPLIELAQTVGRVIRLDKRDSDRIQNGNIPAGACQFYHKPTGFVTVPVYKNHGKRAALKLQNVVNTIFKEGKPVEALTN